MIQIEWENISGIINGESNGCSDSKIKFVRMNQIDSEILSKIESEILSKVGNSDLNALNGCLI